MHVACVQPFLLLYSGSSFSLLWTKINVCIFHSQTKSINQAIIYCSTVAKWTSKIHSWTDWPVDMRAKTTISRKWEDGVVISRLLAVIVAHVFAASINSPTRQSCDSDSSQRRHVAAGLLSCYRLCFQYNSWCCCCCCCGEQLVGALVAVW